MHPALRKGPLFTKHPQFSTFFTKKNNFCIFFTKNTPISFPAYGPAVLPATRRRGDIFALQKAVWAEFLLGFATDFLVRHMQ